VNKLKTKGSQSIYEYKLEMVKKLLRNFDMRILHSRGPQEMGSIHDQTKLGFK